MYYLPLMKVSMYAAECTASFSVVGPVLLMVSPSFLWRRPPKNCLTSNRSVCCLSTRAGNLSAWCRRTHAYCCGVSYSLCTRVVSFWNARHWKVNANYDNSYFIKIVFKRGNTQNLQIDRPCRYLMPLLDWMRWRKQRENVLYFSVNGLVFISALQLLKNC